MVATEVRALCFGFTPTDAGPVFWSDCDPENFCCAVQPEVAFKPHAIHVWGEGKQASNVGLIESIRVGQEELLVKAVPANLFRPFVTLDEYSKEAFDFTADAYRGVGALLRLKAELRAHHIECPVVMPKTVIRVTGKSISAFVLIGRILSPNGTH